MFDIGFTELLLVAVIGLIVIGPEKLPHTIRMLRAWITRIKSTVTELQIDLEKELDAEEMKKRLTQTTEQSTLTEIKKDLENSLNPASDKTQPDANATPANGQTNKRSH